MLITERYKEINRELHKNIHFGRGGGGWYKSAQQLMVLAESEDLLDYGCGKGTLNQKLKQEIKEYDPAIDGKDSPPEPADVVMCCDVLEHIEPKCLFDVLNDLARVVKKYGFFTIATRPARKTLPDGRNAHLIVKDAQWWLDQLTEHFTIRHIELDASTAGELVVLVSPKGEAKYETDPNLYRL